jgi:hypothetical protein
MKRWLTIVACGLALVTATATAHAQTIGFKLGPTWSKMHVDPDDGSENSMLSSLGGGGFVRFGFAGLSLQLEALALTKGSKVEDPNTDDDGKLKLNYVEVPVTAMFSLGSGPYAFIGPAVAFETSCELSAEFGGAEVTVDCDDPGADTLDRKKIDFGVTGGVGLQFAMGPGHILVEGRYTHGLSNINDSGTEKLRNRSFAAFAGYAIPLKVR